MAVTHKHKKHLSFCLMEKPTATTSSHLELTYTNAVACAG